MDVLVGTWFDPNAPVSQHAPGDYPGSQRDLPTINNFWGSVGVAPEGVRPVDLFAINALELPPFAGCGADQKQTPFGCGRFLVDGQHVMANATQWAAFEVKRRALLPSGLLVESTVRMPFEQNGVMWEVRLQNVGSVA